MLGDHSVPRTDIYSINPENLDGIVIEDCGLGSIFLKPDDIEFGPLVRAAKENNKPLFTLDIPSVLDASKYYDFESRIKLGGVIGMTGAAATASFMAHKNKMTRRRFIALGGMFLASLGAFASGFAPDCAISDLNNQGEEASAVSVEIISIESRIVQTEILSMRNAVNARKIEEYLAPMLMEKAGKKPKIALAYGTYHAGLKDNITDKELRDSVITYFSSVLAEGKKNETFERMLNNVYEFIPLDYGLEAKVHKTGLF